MAAILVPSVRDRRILLGAWYVALLMLGVGLATRIAGVASLAGGLYFFALRSVAMQAHHEDSVMIVVLFALAVSPCGCPWTPGFDVREGRPRSSIRGGSTGTCSSYAVFVMLAALTLAIELTYPLAFLGGRFLIIPACFLVMLVGFRIFLGPSMAFVFLAHAFWVPWKQVIDRWTARGPDHASRLDGRGRSVPSGASP